MKELLLQYAHYHVWANKRIIDVLLQLTEEQPDQELVSSFPSIRATVHHMWQAESIWLQRLQLVERPVWLADDHSGSFADICAQWLQVSVNYIAFIEKQFDERSFQHVVQYYKQKQHYKLPVFTILNHVFNHATFHRGQLITMLRQVGVTKLLATDLSAFAIG